MEKVYYLVFAEKALKVDTGRVEAADDGNTTHFGGYLTCNGQDYWVSGNDRDGGFIDALGAAAAEQLGRELTDEEYDQLLKVDYP
jgi:hypothetical protein